MERGSPCSRSRRFPSPSGKYRCKGAGRTESTPWRNLPMLTSQRHASFPSLLRPSTKMPGPGHSVVTDKSLLPVRSLSQNYLGDGRHWTTGVDLDLKYDILSVGQHMLPLNFTCKSGMLKAVPWAKQAFAIEHGLPIITVSTNTFSVSSLQIWKSKLVFTWWLPLFVFLCYFN